MQSSCSQESTTLVNYNMPSDVTMKMANENLGGIE